MEKKQRLPTPRSNWGFFLDVDGTLLEIAPTPTDVTMGEKVLGVLDALYRAAGGAVALISGRPLDQLDQLFAPLRLPAAGLHGLEVRTAQGETLRPPAPSRDFERMREALGVFAAEHSGLLFEDKGYALALHYRLAPEFEDACRICVEDAVGKWGDGYQILAGKKVFEIKPSQANKGKVIEALMADMPFTDRCPVYIGDDITDEDGFAAVNRLGGYSIRVGASPTTCARYAVPDVSRLLDWLADVATRMRPPVQ